MTHLKLTLHQLKQVGHLMAKLLSDIQELGIYKQKEKELTTTVMSIKKVFDEGEKIDV